MGRVQGRVKGDVQLRVRESISDLKGNHWADVSSWFWAATLGRGGQGPWLVTTISEGVAASARHVPERDPMSGDKRGKGVARVGAGPRLF